MRATYLNDFVVFCVFRSDCGGPCLASDDSTLSSPVTGHHFRPRDRDVTGYTPSCHDDTCCVAKSLLLHGDTISNDTSTTGVRSNSPSQARFIYESRPAVVTSDYSSTHAVVLSSKPPAHTTCDCGTIEDDHDDATWRLTQSPSRTGDEGVQYYVIDRRKLTGAMRLTTFSAAKRTSPTSDEVNQLRLRGTRADNSDNLAGKSLVGECRPLLVVSPGECYRTQRCTPVPASLDNSSQLANSPS